MLRPDAAAALHHAAPAAQPALRRAVDDVEAALDGAAALGVPPELLPELDSRLSPTDDDDFDGVLLQVAMPDHGVLLRGGRFDALCAAGVTCSASGAKPPGAPAPAPVAAPPGATAPEAAAAEAAAGAAAPPAAAPAPESDPLDRLEDLKNLVGDEDPALATEVTDLIKELRKKVDCPKCNYPPPPQVVAAAQTEPQVSA